jgi:hypothetical protein
MGYTDGKWQQAQANNDLVVFLGADQWTDFAAVSTLPTAPAAGLIYKVVPTTAASKFFITGEHLFLRSGILGSANFDQNQFGTAAAVPGPSAVAGTSGPLGTYAGYPPIPGAQMNTVGLPVTGAPAKGIQINSIDVIYQVLAVAASAATIGLTKTSFVNLAAPVVTNIIALGANGLPTVIGAQPQVTTVAVASPSMIVASSDLQVLLNVNLTAGSGGTINFYGAVIRCSYNFN